MSVKWQSLVACENFATNSTLHSHFFLGPSPMDYNVQTMLNQAGKGVVTFPAIVGLFPPLQMEFAIVTLERRFTLKSLKTQGRKYLRRQKSHCMRCRHLNQKILEQRLSVYLEIDIALLAIKRISHCVTVFLDHMILM
jgi:hypothetical protein